MSNATIEAVPDHRRESPARGGYGRGRTWGAVASEWTKMWSVRATWWCLAGALALMGILAPGLGGSTANAYRDDGIDTTLPIADPAAMALNLVQFALVALAMLTITVEYSTGSIRTTLQCVPLRGRMLFAKSAVAAPVMFVAGVALTAIGAVLTTPLLFEYADTDLGKAVPTVLLAGVYTALITVFTIGVGAVLRSAVGTLTTVFMLLAGLPAALALSSSDFAHKLADYLPSTAGQHLMVGDTEPYGRPGALLVIIAWVVAAQVVGYLALRKRDA